LKYEFLEEFNVNILAKNNCIWND